MTQVVHEVSAEKEFEKNSDLKREDLTTLKAWLDTQQHLPAITDEMTIMFLHSCYFDVEKTKDCIENYYTMRTHAPEFFCDRDTNNPALATALTVLQFACLPKRDPNGYQIVYQGLKDYDASKYVLTDAIKLLFMTIDACLHSAGTPEGFVIWTDMKGLRLTHLLKLNPFTLRRGFQYLQEANPVRLKAIHVLNTLPIVDNIMAVMKPFIKKELLDLMQFHTGDMETLFKTMPKESVPSDFGGDFMSVEELSAENATRLQSLTAYFDEDEKKWRVNENNRLK